MKKIFPLLLSGFLMVSAAACTSKTSESANNDGANNQAATETQQDATSEVRKDQIESDTRAREQRNNITGGDADRDDGDLESQVRGKLETNLPASMLEVDAEDGTVKISGNVPTKEQYDKIQPLARQIKGVKAVNMDVTIGKTN